MQIGVTSLDDPPERAEAWLAVCRLHDALTKADASEMVDIYWKDAITQTERWIEVLLRD
jgi:hypothetical protein